MKTNFALFLLIIFAVATVSGWGWPDIAKIMPVYVAAMPGLLMIVIQIYREAIRMNRNSWEAHFELAGELAATDQVAESVQEYLEVVRLNPRHAVARVNLGVMLVRQNRLDEAMQQFESALALDPNNAAAQNYLRQVAARRNQNR